MTLPEHILNETCDHGVVRMQCDTEECDRYLSQLGDDAAADILARRASGELI